MLHGLLSSRRICVHCTSTCTMCTSINLASVSLIRRLRGRRNGRTQEVGCNQHQLKQCRHASKCSTISCVPVCCDAIPCELKVAIVAAADVPFEDEQANRYWLTPNGDRLGYDPNVSNVSRTESTCDFVPAVPGCGCNNPSVCNYRRTGTAGSKTGRRSTSGPSTTIRRVCGCAAIIELVRGNAVHQSIWEIKLACQLIGYA